MEEDKKKMPGPVVEEVKIEEAIKEQMKLEVRSPSLPLSCVSILGHMTIVSSVYGAEGR